MLESVTRRLISNDWLTILFIVSLICVTITKALYAKRFSLFLLSPITNNYQNSVEHKEHNIVNWFTAILFVVQVISLAIFLYLCSIYFFPEYKQQDYFFTKIISFTTLFIIAKFLIEKIIAIILDIEWYINTYNFQKITSRNLYGLALLPINLILVYTTIESKIVYMIILGSFLLFNCISFFFLFKNHQKLIFSKLFYFILYLCALEIAPYLIIYKTLIK